MVRYVVLWKYNFQLVADKTVKFSAHNAGSFWVAWMDLAGATILFCLKWYNFPSRNLSDEDMNIWKSYKIIRTTGWRIIWKKIIAVIDATFAVARINLSSIALMFQHRWCQSSLYSWQVSRLPLFDLFLYNTVWWMTNKVQEKGTREVIHTIHTLLRGSYRS